MAVSGGFVSYRHAECFFLADKDDHPLATGDSGIEEIPLEQEVLLHGQRDDNDREFRALAFVNGDSVGKFELVEFAELVGDLPLAEPNAHLLLFLVDCADAADIAVKDLFIVVIRCLDDLVSDAEEISEALILLAVLAVGIERGLKTRVEFTDSEAPAVHRAEDLDVLDGIDPQVFR